MDITLCKAERNGELCPIREDCKRYIYSLHKETYVGLNSFISIPPWIQKMDGLSCDMFVSYRESLE